MGFLDFLKRKKKEQYLPLQSRQQQMSHLFQQEKKPAVLDQGSTDLGTNLSDIKALVKIGFGVTREQLSRIEDTMAKEKTVSDLGNSMNVNFGRLAMTLEELSALLGSMKTNSGKLGKLGAPNPNVEPTIAAQTAQHLTRAVMTLRLQEVLKIVRESGQIRTHELGVKLGIKNSSAREFLGRLVALGFVRDLGGGLYEAAGRIAEAKPVAKTEPEHPQPNQPTPQPVAAEPAQ
jgi:hypothetical protein